MERRHVTDGSQTPIVAPCRHCGQPQILAAQRAEMKDGRAWHRCRACNAWFLIRWDDAVALGLLDPVDDPVADRAANR